MKNIFEKILIAFLRFLCGHKTITKIVSKMGFFKAFGRILRWVEYHDKVLNSFLKSPNKFIWFVVDFMRVYGETNWDHDEDGFSESAYLWKTFWYNRSHMYGYQRISKIVLMPSYLPKVYKILWEHVA